MTGHLFDLQNTITLQEFAYLSLNVYHDKKDDYILGDRPLVTKDLYKVKNSLNKPGWYQIESQKISSFQDTSDGFYADFYIKICNQKIRYLVVAFRGTANLLNFIEDAGAWKDCFIMGNHHSLVSFPYMLKARVEAFCFLMLDRVKAFKKAGMLADNAQHFLTGHSLGGAMAHIAHGVPSHSFGKRSVVFNAPGLGNSTDFTLNNCEGFAMNIRACYDLVSIMGEPYGFNISVNVPEGAVNAKQYWEPIFNWVNNNHNNPATKAIIEEIITDHDRDDIEKTKKIIIEAYLPQHSMNNLYQSIQNSPSHNANFEHMMMISKQYNGYHNIGTQAMITTH